MAVPKFLQTYLASYDLSGLDVRRDRDIIITEILNKGDQEAVNWLYQNYSKQDVRNIIRKPIKGMWLKSVLQYWLKIFDLRLNDEKFNEAIININ